MRLSWTYGIAIDASIDSFGTPLLDIRIRVCLPSAELLRAYIVAMPMFESHTGLHMLDVVIKVTDSLDTVITQCSRTGKRRTSTTPHADLNHAVDYDPVAPPY
jgi:hypothetical protein